VVEVQELDVLVVEEVGVVLVVDALIWKLAQVSQRSVGSESRPEPMV
jgi:hypothetical protein